MRVVFSIIWAALLPSQIAAQALPDHTLFSSVLQQFMRGTAVDYSALKENRSGLDAYLREMALTDTEQLAGATEPERLAFWINAYNACVIRLVIDHYPIKKRGFPASLMSSLKGVPDNSVRQISDTWSREFCPIAGADRSLDEIEHEIIRPMGEPRIHFAVNCASRSCPILAQRAYTAEGLESQLDTAVQRFVSDTAQFRLERGENPRLVLNKILDWYGEDFGGEEGVIVFLLEHVGDNEKEFIRGNLPIRVDFAEYDWTLNDVAAVDTLLGDLTGDWRSEWNEQELAGRSNDFRKSVDGESVRVRSENSASALWRSIDYPGQNGVKLGWRWKTDRVIPGNTREREKAGDDYSARLFVVFDGTPFESRTKSICYVWASSEYVGAAFINPHVENVATVVLQSGDNLAGQWITEERDVTRDYEALFGRTPNSVTGVAIMVDTDNTRTSAVSWFADVVVSLDETGLKDQ